jgi:hypothetical protein
MKDVIESIIFFHGLTAIVCLGFQITLTYTTVGRTPTDECSARRRDYLTKLNTHTKGRNQRTWRDSNP